MKRVLLTGGAGFFGEILRHRLLDDGYACVSIDLEADENRHPNLTSIRGDIRDQALLEEICGPRRFDAIFHCAAVLAHELPDPDFLWTSNVEGTRRLAEVAKKFRIPKIVFTSTNCLWAKNFHRPVKEDDVPAPVEAYGRSKWEAEKILQSFAADFDTVIIRTPTIMDSGRLGLLAILYEFIYEGRKVWVVGDGSNRYQFIYAADLADAVMRGLDYAGSDVFNVGSERVRSMRDVYQYVVDRARTGARVASLPKALILPAMRMLYRLHLSPLGPYQYKMIAEDFEFDTTKAREKLGWAPTLTNEEMLWKAYEYYASNREEILKRQDVSAHKKAAKMGAISILKWIS